MKSKTFQNLTNKSFGNWIVENRGPNDDSGRTRWFCRCKCGEIYLIHSLNLVRGATKSCSKCANRKTHGMSSSKTYSIWVQMNERCHTEKHPSYHNYGKRGIYVCEHWRKSFENFLEDMGESPKNMSLDRINNDIGYFKSNCRWSDWKTQCRNKRNSIKDGEIYNGWKVLSKINNEKKYNIQCISCKKELIIWSCNVRIKKPCRCLNINEV